MQLSTAEIKESLEEMQSRMRTLCDKLVSDPNLAPQTVLAEIEYLGSQMQHLVILVERQTPNTPEQSLPSLTAPHRRYLRS